MKLSHIALVVLGLWALRRIGHVREVDDKARELAMTPADPYASVTFMWDQLNGTISPNMHPSLNQVVGGIDQPYTANPCMCR